MTFLHPSDVWEMKLQNLFSMTHQTTNLFRNWLYLLFVAFLISCSSSEDPIPMAPPGANQQTDIASVDSKIETFITQYNIPGASLAIAKNGKLVYQKAYGVSDVANSTEMTTSNLFRVASVSKTFTGLGIMLLVQEGKISLDDQVFGEGAILGTTYGNNPYSERVKKVTVRNLLQMTTGGWVINGNRDAIDSQQQFTNDQFFDWMMDNASLTFEPGSNYFYVNTNYFVAARIIEKVSGQSFADFLKTNVFDPLGMTNTALARNGESGRYPNEVTYYGQGATQGFEYNFNIERRDGDAGIVTTAPDLLRFVTAIDNYTARPDLLNPQNNNDFISGSSANPGFGNGIASGNQVRYFYGALPGTRSGYMFHTSNGMSAALIFNGNPDYFAASYPNFASAHDALMNELVKEETGVYQDLDQF